MVRTPMIRLSNTAVSLVSQFRKLPGRVVRKCKSWKNGRKLARWMELQSGGDASPERVSNHHRFTSAMNGELSDTAAKIYKSLRRGRQPRRRP